MLRCRGSLLVFEDLKECCFDDSMKFGAPAAFLPQQDTHRVIKNLLFDDWCNKNDEIVAVRARMISTQVGIVLVGLLRMGEWERSTCYESNDGYDVFPLR